MRPFRVLPLPLAAFLATGCMSQMNAAARSGDIKTLQKLLDAGHHVDEPQQGGYNGGTSPQTSLMIAAGHGNLEAVRFLLSKGANPNYTDPQWGTTPLSSAMWSGNLEVAKLLLDAGADPNARDREGETILERARKYQRPYAVIKFFETAGAAPAATTGAPAAAPPAPTRPVQAPALFPGYTSPARADDYAVVIGVEQYADLPPAQYAERDAEAFRRFVLALGVPERNVMSLSGTRATKTGFEKTFEAWLPNNATADSRVFVYYSGHGSPDPATGDAYLLPSDGDPQYLKQTGYPLKRLYAQLGSLKSKRVLVALDSCFSGAGGRSVLPKGTRPLVNRVDTAVGASDGLVVMSASAADQISGTDEAAGHGLFTYNLLQGLNGAAADAQGRVTAKSLHDYLAPRVEDKARRGNRQQTPQLMGASPELVLRER
ncbi:MAG: caspase family protein [Elusimicrobiota bacterium]|nr:caspase family protein [Elusimicrobiota bacterium]